MNTTLACTVRSARAGRFAPLLALVLAAPAARAAQDDAPGPEALAALAEEVRGYVGRDLVVGAELAVLHRRRVVLHEVFGWRDREDERPMERGTLFNLRSMTKPLTGAAVQLLVDAGELQLDARVADVLPSFDHGQAAAITIRQLLTHTSGLPLSVLTSGGIDQYGSLRAMADAAGRGGPQFEPGSKFWYSDAGSEVLGAVVEVVSGQSLEEFVRERLLEPLGMRDTFVALDGEDPRFARMASLYVGAPGAWERFWKPADGPFYPFAWGSQSLHGTPLDYARFLGMWIDGGLVGGETLLSPEAVQRTLTPVRRMSALGSDMPHPCELPGLEAFYGQMAVLYAPAGEPGEHAPVVVGHSGSDGTWAWAWPERDLIVLYFTQSRGQASGVRLEQVLDRLLIHPGAEAEPLAAAPERYRPFVGTYVANFARFRQERFRVLVRDGRLALDIPSQVVVPLDEADDAGRRYFSGTKDVWLTFDCDEAGRATVLKLHQGPYEFLAPREGLRLGEKVDPALAEPYLGRYRCLTPPITIEVLVRDERLAVDWPGETVYELQPPDDEGVSTFLACAQFRLTFVEDEQGRVVSATYRQPGVELHLERVEGDGWETP